MSELWGSDGAHAGPASSESQSTMIDGGRSVQMACGSSGTEFSQGQISACARLLVVSVEATILAIAGWGKRRELRNGGGVHRRFSPQAQPRRWVIIHSPE